MSQKQEIIIKTEFEGINLDILYNETYEWLIESKQVAEAYGVDESTIRHHKKRHADELIHNKHFTSVTNSHAGLQRVTIYWTKRGVIRLGFFIKSERAKLFRDWAEDLILNHLEKKEDYKIYFEQRLAEFKEEFILELIKMMHLVGDASYSLSQRYTDRELAIIKERLSALESQLSSKAITETAPREAYVYLLHKLGTNEYKLGKSVAPLNRKKQLEQGGIKLALVLSMKFKSEELALAWEKILQRTFKSSHLRGEWYLLSKPELSFLLELAKAKEILD